MENLKYLFTSILFLLCSTVATAHKFEVNGIFYNITDETNKTVAVTYKGTSYNEYFAEYTGIVVIPENVTYNGNTYSVTSIGDYAFLDCIGLTSITIGNSVTSIGDYAFDGCSGLTSVTIPNSVTSIGDGAFRSCDGLTSVTIGNSVTSIGDWVFRGCTGLTSVTIGNSVTSIGEAAFSYCSGLTSITIPNSVTSIGGSAFYGCTGLTSITIPNSVTSIGGSAFYGCTGLTSITIPNSVTSIGNYAFDACTSLKELYIEDGEGTLSLGHNHYSNSYNVGEGLFYDCPLETLYLGRNLSYNKGFDDGYSPFYNIKTLTSVTIGNSVTSIGYGAFRGCTGLASIVVENGNSVYDSRNNCNAIIETATNELIAGCKNTVIPNSVTSIGDDAFVGCTGLTSVTIPNSVTSIGGSAFYGCSGLTSIIIPNSVTSIGNYAFDACTSLKELYIEDGEGTLSLGYNDYSNPSGEGLFYDCPLETLYLGRNLSYNKGLDYGYSPLCKIETLTSVTIGNSVTSIGSYAFYDCSGLTSVTIGNSVTSIGYCAFEDCTGLTSITIPNSVTSIGGSAFDGCTGLTSITIPNSVTSIGEAAFSYCSGLTSITIPNSVTSIGGYAFRGCTGLTSVIIPNSVTSIGDDAFRGCTGLTSVTIGNSVTSIGYRAFYGCSGLTSVTIGNSVTSIGFEAFDGCTGLTSVTIPNSVTIIGNNAFNGCTELKEVHISDLAAWCNIKFDDSTANPLYYAHKLYLNGKLVTDLVIPDGISEIKNYAFRGCTGLTSIIIPNSVTSIGGSAFYGCTGLKEVLNLSNLNFIKGGESNGYVAYYAVKVINAPNGSIEGDFIFYAENNKYLLVYYSGNDNKVILPDSCNGNSYIITADVFQNNTSITDFVIPNGVVGVEENAFYNTGWYNNQPDGILKLSKWVIGYKGTAPSGELNINKKEIGIADGAFKNCSDLTAVSIGDNIKSIGSSAFSYCTGLTSVTIGNSVTSIGDWAFRGCTGLTSVTIGNSVTSIGDYAFQGCTGLKEVHISDLAAWCYIKFDDNTTNPLYYAHNLYLNGKLVTDLVIPDGISEIKNCAFYGCTGLTSVTIGNSVTRIGGSAFDGCTGLTSITIPNSVTSIGGSFYRCTGLKEVHISDLAAWCNIKFDVNIANPLYYAHNLYLNGKLVTDLVIPDGISEIKNHAFRGCTGLTSVTIPNSVTSIGDWAFLGCTGLTSVTIPNSVTSIGDDAFSNCRWLTSVTIGNSVTSIGWGAFCDCSGLKKVHISDLSAWCNIEFGSYNANPLYYAKNLYLNGELLTNLIIPDGVTKIKNYAFYGCTGLKEIYVKSKTPIELNYDPFGSAIYDTTALIVPLGSKENYRTSDYWKNFKNIAEFDYDKEELYKEFSDWTSTNTDNSTTSSNSYTFEAVAGGKLSFDWEVSSEEEYDWFIVTLNGAEIVKESGEKSGSYEYTFTENGTYTLVAEYTKDDEYSEGGNYGKIYNIQLCLPLTDVEEIQTDDSFQGTKNVYYDLNGRKVENPTSGIYIINGKKVFVK